MAQQVTRPQQPGLKEFKRNKYFYGKLLDVFHLELETSYFNSKRWLLNRLVIGPGVVCGLDVELVKDKKAVVVKPGVAIDFCGREIVVAQTSQPVPLPPFPEHPGDTTSFESPHKRGERHEYCREEYAHVILCYRECDADPIPVLGGDCVPVCAPGAIREHYEIKIRKGYVPEPKSNFPDVIERGYVDRRAIIDHISRYCRPVPDDCCIPLANILLRHTPKGWEPEVDIYIRRIVYTNRLLFDLIQALAREEESE